MVEKLWEVAATLFEPDQTAAGQWVESQKSHLWQGHCWQVIRAIRLCCPQVQPLPEKMRLVVGYIFNHRSRIRYGQFRQAGYPVGSGTVESACKLVMQERMKQVGMRWSRDGAEAILALRSVLLSERWDDVWATFRSKPKLA